jgi:hypothetical protein
MTTPVRPALRAGLRLTTILTPVALLGGLSSHAIKLTLSGKF